MTCWRRRIESIFGSAWAETHGNSAKANRGEYEGAFISTQLRGWQRGKQQAAVNAELAGPETDNRMALIRFPAPNEKSALCSGSDINVNAATRA
jgi:hypothetical protein